MLKPELQDAFRAGEAEARSLPECREFDRVIWGVAAALDAAGRDPVEIPWAKFTGSWPATRAAQIRFSVGVRWHEPLASAEKDWTAEKTVGYLQRVAAGHRWYGGGTPPSSEDVMSTRWVHARALEYPHFESVREVQSETPEQVLDREIKRRWPAMRRGSKAYKAKVEQGMGAARKFVADHVRNLREQRQRYLDGQKLRYLTVLGDVERDVDYWLDKILDVQALTGGYKDGYKDLDNLRGALNTRKTQISERRFHAESWFRVQGDEPPSDLLLGV